MENWKENISFMLIEPKKPGNIGASARAIMNMGFKNLELVNPGKFLADEAMCMAYNAIDVLEKAKIPSSFKDAVKDKSIVIGTTKILGERKGLILPLKDGIKRIITARKNKIAILFGREDKGLTNKEVSHPKRENPMI